MFLRSATAPFTLCIYIPAQVFPLVRNPNPFSSFISLRKKSLAVVTAKASDALRTSGNLTVKCWAQQPHSCCLSPLRCNCWVISVLGDRFQASLFSRALVERSSWKHLLILLVTLSSSEKGWQRFRKTLSQEAFWFVSCSAVTLSPGLTQQRHQMWDMFFDPQLFIFPHSSGGSSDVGITSHQNEAQLKSSPWSF